MQRSFEVSVLAEGKIPLKERLRRSLADIDGKTPETAETGDWAKAVAAILRDEMEETWQQTEERQSAKGVKSVNYLSLEYLLGPHMQTALHATGLDAEMREALAGSGADADKVIKHEPDPGLGNGGLGRLAACFLDSGANLGLPMTGYGLFYKDGFFRQRINEGGGQEVEADPWVSEGGHWGAAKPEINYDLQFFGWNNHNDWQDELTVSGSAVDFMIPAYDGKTVNTLRLWKIEGLDRLNTGDPEKNELLRRINDRLYPDDSTDFGKKLRLMQEYAFTSLSLQDIVRRHYETNASLDNLAETAAIQLNDTHPAIAVAELMRILIDDEGIEWERAKQIVRETCFYTNHTLMPEALEQWPEGMMEYVLPRHKGIIMGLDWDLKQEVEAKIPQEEWDACKDRVAIIRDGKIRMGHLAAFCTGGTNGVSAMHSDLVRERLFPDLEVLRPEGGVTNHTNGITPRRWLKQANPGLAALITEQVGSEDWITDLSSIDEALAPLQDDEDFQRRFAAIKRENKERFAAYVKETGGPEISADAFYDAQIKRFHAYKRQFMNILHTVALYQDILENPDKERPDTVKIFAGKAAPSYFVAKEYIALVNQLADKINSDPNVGGKLKVVFVEDYNVSKAQLIIPAADLSEQISTAGTEASGTSNMKFALNGARTMGTRDGANVEIGERTGEENISFFGHTKEELDALDEAGYDPQEFLAKDERLVKALEFVADMGFKHLADDITEHGDHWKLAADFVDYWTKQEEARALYMNDPQAWLTQAIANIRAGSHFSSDDTIKGYAQKTWKVGPGQPEAEAKPVLAQPVPVV